MIKTVIPVLWFAANFTVGYVVTDKLFKREKQKQQEMYKDVDKFIMENDELREKFERMRTRSW